MSINSVHEYETRAREAEESPTPFFLKVGRGVVWFVYAVVVVIIVVLLLAFVLRLVGASTDAAFTRWVYRSSESAMRPFRGIFPVKEVGEVSVLDPSLLFGAIAYIVLATGIDALYRRVGQRLQTQQREVAQARADADAVRLQFEAMQQQAAFAAAQQHSAQQFAAQQEALRRQAEQAAAGVQRPPV
jgi:uncharacterized protein YggT (Ycf19 family)